MTLPTAVSSPPPSLDSVPPLGSPGVQAAGRRASLVIFLLQFALNALGAAGGLRLIAVVTPHRAGSAERGGGAKASSRAAAPEQGPTLFSPG